MAECHIRIDTYNSFPTAAGMASSASGIACLTKAMSELFNLHSVEDEKLLNEITRMASGSACRSLYGGLVKWECGDDDYPSIAKQVSIGGISLCRYMMKHIGQRFELPLLLFQTM